MSSLGEVRDVPGSSSPGIFLSYRREDAAPYARLLQHELRERFPDAQVFMDLDSVEAGLPFAEVIRDAVDSCAVLVALIGRQWVTLADEQGNRRLDDAGDFVRFEVQTALERGVRVIPVLVDGASPPHRQQLPSELHKLAGLNALELSTARYDFDASRLLDVIQRVLADRQAREEADRKARQEADRKAREEADGKAWQEADRKARQEALQKAESTAGEEAELTAREEAELPAREERADAAGQAGDAAAARDQYAALLPVQERVVGAKHPSALASRAEFARWTRKAGDDVDTGMN